MRRLLIRRARVVLLAGALPFVFAGCMGYPAQVPAGQDSAPTMAPPESSGESRLPGLLSQLQAGSTGIELFDGSQNDVLAAQDAQDKADGATPTTTGTAPSGTSTPTPTRTPAGSLPLTQPTATPTPRNTPAATPSPAPSTEAAPTATPTPIATSTPVPTPTATPIATVEAGSTPPTEGGAAPTQAPPTEG